MYYWVHNTSSGQWSDCSPGSLLTDSFWNFCLPANSIGQRPRWHPTADCLCGIPDAAGEYWVVYQPGGKEPRLHDGPFKCFTCASRSLTGLGQTVLLAVPGEEGKLPELIRYRAVLPERIGEEPNEEGRTAQVELPARHACRNCGEVGHNSRTCRATHVNYDKVGVELEGIYEPHRLAALRRTMANTEDGSIRRMLTQPGSYYEGREFQTHPNKLGQCLAQVASHYPNMSNSSCGMHVHTSFKDYTAFSQLMTPEFVEYFQERFRAWGVAQRLNPRGLFFARLRGECSYCLPNTPDKLTQPMETERYLQLNFTSYSEHHTVECRLLPMFYDAALAISAITELIKIYEDWLNHDQPADLPCATPSVPTTATNQCSAVAYVTVPNAREQRTVSLKLTTPPPAQPGSIRISRAKAASVFVRDLIGDR